MLLEFILGDYKVWTVPGLSKTDAKNTRMIMFLADENLQLFANELIAINKDNGYPKPSRWLVSWYYYN